MAIVINGSGTITGISVGGLPDGVVDSGTLATNSVDSAELIDGAVDNSHLATGIDATKLADGTVTSTELQYINSLSSNAQTQIDGAGVSVKVIEANRLNSTADGTQDITGFGFDPKYVSVMSLIGITDDFCWGVSDFTTSRVMHSEGTTTAVLTAWITFIRIEETSGNVSEATVSAITDGIRLTWTKTGSPTARSYFYLTGWL